MEFHETGTEILEEGDLGGDKLELDTSTDEISQLIQSLQPHNHLAGPNGVGRPDSVPPGLDFDLCQTDIVGGSDFVLDHSSVFDIAESVIENKNASDFYHDAVSTENPNVQVDQNSTNITKTDVLSALASQPTNLVSDSLCNLQIIPVDHLQIVSTINTSQGIQVIVAPRASTVGDLTPPAFLIGSLVSVPIKKSNTMDSGITNTEFCSIDDQNLPSTDPYEMILNLAHNQFIEQSNQLTCQQQPIQHTPSYESMVHTVFNEFNKSSSNPRLSGKSHIFVQELEADFADNNVGICVNSTKQYSNQEEIISQTIVNHSAVRPKCLFTSNPVGEAAVHHSDTQLSTCKTCKRKEIPRVTVSTNKPDIILTDRSELMPETLYFKDKRSNIVSDTRENTNSSTDIPIPKVTSVDEATQCLSPGELSPAVPFMDKVLPLGLRRKDGKIHKKVKSPLSLVGTKGGSDGEKLVVSSRMTVSQVLELTRKNRQDQEGYRKDKLPLHPPITFKVKSRDGRIKTIHINPVEVEGFMIRKSKIYTEQTGPAVIEREHLQISKPTEVVDEVVDYTCDICNISFSTAEDHTEHNRTHENDSICLMDMDKYGQCKLGQKCVANHTKARTEELLICKRSQADQKFRCDLCTASFSRLGNFTRHRMIHNIREEYRFKCPECGRKFLQKCDMSRHRLIHSKQEPFKCPECGKGYIRRSDLEVHRRFHKQERVFKCPHCVKSFYQSGDVSRHIRLIHKRTSQLTCGHCSRNYANESTLIKHMQSKHQDIIMNCLSMESSIRANHYDEATAMVTSPDDLHSNQMNNSSWLTSDLQPQSESLDCITVIKPTEAELSKYQEAVSQSTLTSESIDDGIYSFHSAPQGTFDVEDPSIENL